MVANELLMQFQSDILNVPVIRPKVSETTALGAAYAAGLAVGFWSGREELRQNWAEDKTWHPAMDPASGKHTTGSGKRRSTGPLTGWISQTHCLCIKTASAMKTLPMQRCWIGGFKIDAVRCTRRHAQCNDSHHKI